MPLATGQRTVITALAGGQLSLTGAAEMLRQVRRSGVVARRAGSPTFGFVIGIGQVVEEHPVDRVDAEIDHDHKVTSFWGGGELAVWPRRPVVGEAGGLCWVIDEPGSDHEVLPAIQQFAYYVKVPGMRCGFDKMVGQHCSQIWERHSCPRPPCFWPRRRIVEAQTGDDAVCVGDRGAICIKDFYDGFVVVDPPVAVVSVRPEVQLTASHHHLEPVTFVGKREVAHKSKAAPAGRQNRSTKLSVAESVELRQHMITLP